MNTKERIYSFFNDRKSNENGQLGNIQITEEKNKNGEQLLYVRKILLEEPSANTFINKATHYVFNLNGEFVGNINTSVCNIRPPSKVEMEYWTCEPFRNQGNITLVAAQVIKEIFEDGIFDGLQVRQGFPMSHIESIIVSINHDNYSSLAVAKKLGFDANGNLSKSEYLSSQNKKSEVKH